MSDLPETKLLQLFDVLYELRSVTRAAGRLGQSQPTISIWLGRLRQQVGDPLFVRTPGGMTPTPRADALIGPCREILASLGRLTSTEPAFDPATAQRRFRICMTDASHITLLPPLLERVRALAPGVRLEAARIDGSTEQALTTGEADLAIGYLPWLSGVIATQELFEQDWVCLASPRHPRVHDRLGRRRYVAEGHVAIAAGTGATLLHRALTTQGIERRVVLELPGFLGGRDHRQHRPAGDPAEAHRHHAGPRQRPGALALPTAGRPVRCRSVLAPALRAGARQPLATGSGRGTVRAAQPEGSQRRLSLSKTSPAQCRCGSRYVRPTKVSSDRRSRRACRCVPPRPRLRPPGASSVRRGRCRSARPHRG